MALRKFSKHMKIVTIIVIFAFAFSAAFAGYQYLVGYFQNKKEVIFTFEDYKIYKKDYDKQLEDLKRQVNKVGEIKNLPEDFYTKIALSTVLDEAVSNILSKKLKVKVSSSSINEEIDKLKEQYGGEDNFALLLAQNQTNLTALKNDIKKELLVRNTIDKLKESVKPTEEELKEIYEIYKYTDLADKTFEESKEELENIHYSTSISLLYHSNAENILLNGKLKTEDEGIKKAFEELNHKDVEYKDMYLTNKDLLNSYFLEYLMNKEYNEELKKNVILKQVKDLEKIEKIANMAKEKGVKPIQGLSTTDEAKYLLNQYFNLLVKEYNPSEEEMLKWFKIHKKEYDINNTVSGNIIGITYKPSEKDLEKTKEIAENLKKEITVENFSEMAIKNSKDPGSAKNGGDLGWADIRSFVPEFAELAKNKVGDIVGPIKTQFGYHIVYVAEKDEKDVNKIHLKHILIRTDISEETKKEAMDKIEDLANKLKAKEVSFEDIINNKENKYSDFDINTVFEDKNINSSLPVVGYNKELLDKVFATEINVPIFESLENGIVLIEKTKEIPFKEATFEGSKGRVRVEMAINNANEEIGK